MQVLPTSRVLRLVAQAIHVARRAATRYSSKLSKRRSTLHQHNGLLRLNARKNTAHRTLLDELIEMPRVRNAVNLTELLPPATLCKAFNRLDMAVWRGLLNLSVTRLPTNGVVGIDASGFDRSHASKHYTKRVQLPIQQLKVTLLVDTRANAILELSVTTPRKHDTQSAPTLIKRNSDDVAILRGDKGYDDQKVRALAREPGVRPLIKPRVPSTSYGVNRSVRC